MLALMSQHITRQEVSSLSVFWVMWGVELTPDTINHRANREKWHRQLSILTLTECTTTSKANICVFGLWHLERSHTWMGGTWKLQTKRTQLRLEPGTFLPTTTPQCSSTNSPKFPISVPVYRDSVVPTYSPEFTRPLYWLFPLLNKHLMTNVVTL